MAAAGRRRTWAGVTSGKLHTLPLQHDQQETQHKSSSSFDQKRTWMPSSGGSRGCSAAGAGWPPRSMVIQNSRPAGPTSCSNRWGNLPRCPEWRRCERRPAKHPGVKGGRAGDKWAAEVAAQRAPISCNSAHSLHSYIPQHQESVLIVADFKES